MQNPKIISDNDKLNLFGTVHKQAIRYEDLELDEGLDYMTDKVFINAYARDYYGLELED